MESKLQTGDALLIVDLQNDFLPGGALAVPDGDKILPIINVWIDAAIQQKIPIIFSRDWHPTDHISFHHKGGPWVIHCVRDTFGAKFPQNLDIPCDCIIVNKATHGDHDVYSALSGMVAGETIPLPDKLHQLQIHRLWTMGLALDYCVKHSALEAKKLGFDVNVVLPACRAIAKESEQTTLRELTQAAIHLETDALPHAK